MQKKMTILEAFNAMVKFLDIYYETTRSDNVGSFLGDLQLREDGSTFDPASWYEWVECVEAVLKGKMIGKNPKKELTIIEALQSMIKFLGIYYKNTSFPEDIGSIIDGLQLKPGGWTINPDYWPLWNQCVQEALEESLKEAEENVAA